ncbi:MAG: oligopeptide transporter, OPT family, partial [Castellaniella sp.]
LISWFARTRVCAQARSTGADPVRLEQASERTGTLFASGLIVGESLVGVVLAIVIVGSMASGGGDAPLAVAGPGFAPIATGIGLLAFVLMCVVFVRRVLGAGRG